VATTDLLITGFFGQLGHAVAAAALRRRLSLVGHDLDTLDIRDADAVAAVVREVGPRTLINCAAATAVDACETDEATATAVNGAAVGNLAAACNLVGAKLLQVSTDYVFSGTSDRPYRESDPPDPASAYGRGKLVGERLARIAGRHLIVRTAWLYGHGGRNFVEAIRDQLAGGARSLRVVVDQVGSPTLTDDLAEALLDLDAAGAGGVVHAVNAGSTSWHGFASEIVQRLGFEAEVIPVTSAEFPRPAPRPPYSVLDTGLLASLLGRPMPPWQDALGRYLEAR
jgi:dTDP-4-dehydrorhamnose reductase